MLSKAAAGKQVEAGLMPTDALFNVGGGVSKADHNFFPNKIFIH